MTPKTLAALHARAFSGASRPWSAAEFEALLADPAISLFADHSNTAFALFRQAGPEAEMLTVCTDPQHRRRGIARNILTTAHAALADTGVETVFLEVSGENLGAMRLYDDLGYLRTGMRPGYYLVDGRRRVDAIVMRLQLRGPD